MEYGYIRVSSTDQNQVTKHKYYYWNRKIADLNRNETNAPLFVEIPQDTEAVSSKIQIKWKE